MTLPTQARPVTPAPATRTEPGQTRILTGEAVHLDLRVAGIGSRGLARLFDLFVQFILYYLLFAISMIIAGWLQLQGVIVLDGAAFSAIVIAVLLAVFVGYPTAMETLTRGRTVGKLILGLRVVRDDGGPVTFRQALTRTLVALAIEWPGLIGAPITWLVTIFVMIASPLNKRLGDHVAGTVVIHERTPSAWGWVPAMPFGLAPWAATLDLTALDDDLALAVRSFLARNRQLREPARSVLGERLVREVAAVTFPPPPPGTPAWMYLAAVHAERHRRARLQLESVRTRSAMVWPDMAPPSHVPVPVLAAAPPPQSKSAAPQ